MLTPPTLKEPVETIRLTIPVSKEVHATFQRLAKASGSSIGRAMGDWLGDTLEAAEFMAETMERARAAPKIVMQEMHAYALGLADETGTLLNDIRKKAQTQRVRQPDGGGRAAAGPSPRPVIRGGKSTTDKAGPRGKKS